MDTCWRWRYFRQFCTQLPSHWCRIVVYLRSCGAYDRSWSVKITRLIFCARHWTLARRLSAFCRGVQLFSRGVEQVACRWNQERPGCKALTSVLIESWLIRWRCLPTCGSPRSSPCRLPCDVLRRRTAINDLWCLMLSTDRATPRRVVLPTACLSVCRAFIRRLRRLNTYFTSASTKSTCDCSESKFISHGKHASRLGLHSWTTRRCLFVTRETSYAISQRRTNNLNINAVNEAFGR